MDLLHLCWPQPTFSVTVNTISNNTEIAMSSSVFVVKAEIVMQNIEEPALATYSGTLLLQLRYVDDTLTTVHKNRWIPQYLSKHNTSFQVTKEIEENGKIPFLDCLVTREKIALLTVYRNQHTLTNYSTKGLTILLHTKRLLNEPWPEEHKLFATHTTV